MGVANVPFNEAERLAALARYEILDTPREEAFDGVTKLIAQICDAPIAVVNLIAEGRQWFKSEVGLGVRETPLESSICAHALLQEDLFVVPDTTKDARFNDNPLVTGDPRLRFYAGSLLVTPDGFPLGTLCVLDYEPRSIDERQRATLEILSDHVMNLIELRRSMRRLTDLNAQVEAGLIRQQRLLAGVAHDIRTPLSTIATGATVLSQMSEEPKIQRVAGQIARAADTAVRLAGDLVDAESVAAGTFGIELRPTPLTPIVRDVLARLEDAARAAEITCTLDIPHSGAWVMGDVDRLTQVFTNLLSNAIGHTPSGGVITLRIRIDDGRVEFSIADSGPGIAASDQERVFEPFWRGSDTKRPGMGLGLSIVKALVLAHHGNVKVHNRAEGGAVFTVSLPSTTDGHGEPIEQQV